MADGQWRTPTAAAAARTLLISSRIASADLATFHSRSSVIEPWNGPIDSPLLAPMNMRSSCVLSAPSSGLSGTSSAEPLTKREIEPLEEALPATCVHTPVPGRRARGEGARGERRQCAGRAGEGGRSGTCLRSARGGGEGARQQHAAHARRH